MTIIPDNAYPILHMPLWGRFGAQTLSCVGFSLYLKAEYKKKKAFKFMNLKALVSD